MKWNDVDDDEIYKILSNDQNQNQMFIQLSMGMRSEISDNVCKDLCHCDHQKKHLRDSSRNLLDLLKKRKVQYGEFEISTETNRKQNASRE